MRIREVENKEELPKRLLLMADPSEKAIRDYTKRGRCFVLEEDAKTKGVFVLLPTRPHTIEVVNIAIDAPYQGQGLGKYMLTEAIKTAELEGYQTIEIGTGNSSLGQLALYQKCGFRITGIDIDFFNRYYSEEIYENGIRCCDMIRLSRDL
ncbi:GNAT family N-acetyltransferase [Lentibacillus saliphilus]|uniref:GNAT family N-acetyltransferase n=1 Tax=Lentibacillus saliphilus TaxID=2737028 RepID=UPI001C309B52|nr:GNAT family N-acetyltransferase [Lentibacillus saliphilus]